MKYFTGSIFLILMIASCSTPEVFIEEPEAVEPESSLPAWYNPNTNSSSDHRYFMGFAMSVASDSSEAVQTGNETAIANVRYEIDRFVEEIREGLVTDGSDVKYNSPTFIIGLRNAVQQLQLSDSEFDREVEEREDGITHVYIRMAITRTEVIDQMTDLISDEMFTGALLADRDEL